jgi:prevent-host-death family protein
MKKRTHVSLTEAKQRLGEFVKRAAYGGETIVLEFRGKPQAAIVGMDELETLRRRRYDKQRAIQAIERMASLREGQPPYDPAKFDVVTEVRKMRQWPDD